MSKKQMTVTKPVSPKPAASEPKPAIPMIAGQATRQKIAKETARIATRAIARVDKANAKPSATDSKVSMSTHGKAKSKPGKRAGMSGLDAAAKVLADNGKPMTTHEIAEVAIKRGLWSTNGKTPHATLYSAIIREIATRGSTARFRKTERGHFSIAKGAR